MLELIIIGVILLIVIAIVIMLYNRLVKLRNKVDEARGHIATQLQRRFDLIPNLVETVKGYAKHERELMQQVTEARASVQRLTPNSTTEEVKSADAQSRQVISGINAVAEAYPQLQASQNFAQLQEELATTENKISFARQNFNDRVYDYNTGVQTFPGNIIAAIFRFAPDTMFDVENEEARKNVNVSFN